MGIGMKKKLMRRFCIWGVYCLCVLLMLIVSGVGGKAEQTAAISANDCYENRIAITFDDGPGDTSASCGTDFKDKHCV